MKKGAALGLFFLIFGIFLFYFISSATQTVSLTPATGEAGVEILYNISIQNTDAALNLDEIALNFYGLNYSSSSLVSDTGQTPTQSGDEFAYNLDNIIPFGATRSFWFNVTEVNLGIFRVNVTTLDDALSAFTENKSITFSDTINPSLAFAVPTPINNSLLSYDYITFTVAAADSGSGIKNVTFYLYSMSDELKVQTDTSAPFSYNFTNLDDDFYYLNATTYDKANNSVSTSGTRTVQINTTSSCVPSWTCSWSTCINGTQTQTNCVDANACNVSPPIGTQTCESCVSNWDCQSWIPEECSAGSNQTRICLDLNGCAVQEIETRTCVITSSSNENASGLSRLTSSTLFFIILGLIIASVLGVFIALMRLKKKSSSGGSDSGYSIYSPPKSPPSPPSMPPPGYANPPGTYNPQPPAYQNSPSSY